MFPPPPNTHTDTPPSPPLPHPPHTTPTPWPSVCAHGVWFARPEGSVWIEPPVRFPFECFTRQHIPPPPHTHTHTPLHTHPHPDMVYVLMVFDLPILKVLFGLNHLYIFQLSISHYSTSHTHTSTPPPHPHHTPHPHSDTAYVLMVYDLPLLRIVFWSNHLYILHSGVTLLYILPPTPTHTHTHFFLPPLHCRTHYTPHPKLPP